MLDLNSFFDLNVILVNNIQFHDSPFFCSVCDQIMSSTLDLESHKDVECCRDCENDFVDKDRVKWLEGWRPSEGEIERAFLLRKKSK
jgi:hypothetical protein